MTVSSPDNESLRAIVQDIAAGMGDDVARGKVADYVSQLANIDPGGFALTLATAEVEVIAAGNAGTRFSIQSISKVFTLAIALGQYGERLWSHVGREPTGDPINSIVQLEHERALPRNPSINAGAISVTNRILSLREALGQLLKFVQYIASDQDNAIDPDVARRCCRTEVQGVTFPFLGGVRPRERSCLCRAR